MKVEGLEITPLLNLEGKRLVLASISSRRKALLELIGLNFEVIDSKLDERIESYNLPEVQVLDLSHKKASKVAETIREGIVIGADTTVVLDREIMGKPRNAAEAVAMLSKLSDRTHTVYTGFTIIENASCNAVCHYERTQVTFRKLQETEIANYIEACAPFDKAGAYGIQDMSAIFVSRIDGCFYNVVGLPIAKFYQALKSFLNK